MIPSAITPPRPDNIPPDEAGAGAPVSLAFIDFIDNIFKGGKIKVFMNMLLMITAYCRRWWGSRSSHQVAL